MNTGPEQGILMMESDEHGSGEVGGKVLFN
jgi:hypothetical protein